MGAAQRSGKDRMGVDAIVDDAGAIPYTWNGEQGDIDLDNRAKVQGIIAARIHSATFISLTPPILRSLGAAVSFSSKLTILE